jgi:hypothetical protein
MHTKKMCMHAHICTNTHTQAITAISHYSQVNSLYVQKNRNSDCTAPDQLNTSSANHKLLTLTNNTVIKTCLLQSCVRIQLWRWIKTLMENTAIAIFRGNAVHHPVTAAQFARTLRNIVPRHGLIPKAHIKLWMPAINAYRSEVLF